MSFKGFIPAAEIRAYYQRGHGGARAVRLAGADGPGGSGSDALLGLPVVAFDAGGIGEWLHRRRKRLPRPVDGHHPVRRAASTNSSPTKPRRAPWASADANGSSGILISPLTSATWKTSSSASWPNTAPPSPISYPHKRMRRSLIVGIAGGTGFRQKPGSPTTSSANCADRSAVVSQDWYYKRPIRVGPRGPRGAAGTSITRTPSTPRSSSPHLDALRHGETVEMPRYDYLHARPAARGVDWNPRRCSCWKASSCSSTMPAVREAVGPQPFSSIPRLICAWIRRLQRDAVERGICRWRKPCGSTRASCARCTNNSCSPRRGWADHVWHTQDDPVLPGGIGLAADQGRQCCDEKRTAHRTGNLIDYWSMAGTPRGRALADRAMVDQVRPLARAWSTARAS